MSPEKRRGCASCLIKDTTTISEYVVLIFGGEDDSRCYRDCWVFEPTRETLTFLATAPDTFTPRSYHSATYMHGMVWLVGGMNKFLKDPKEQIVADSVWCFDVSRKVFVHAPCESQHLLIRTAHGACVMPGCSTTILIFGGYAYQNNSHPSSTGNGTKEKPPGKNTMGEWTSDLLELDTVAKACCLQETMHQPSPRGYMTFDAIGDVCVALFGRSRRRLVPSISMYDPSKGEWVNSVPQEGRIPALRHSHRVSKFQHNSLLIYGGSLERDSDLNRGRLEVVSILTYHNEHRGFSWESVSFDGEHNRRFSHVQAFLNNSLHIIGGYSTQGGSRQYPSNIGRIVFETPDEDMMHDDIIQDLETCTCLITNMYFAPAQIDHNLSQDLHSLERTLQLEESIVPETNETVVSESEEHQLKKRRQSVSLQRKNSNHFINLEEELKISDTKWKDASKECSFWKLLAEEEREKYEHASMMLLEKEEEHTQMEGLVRELRVQIKAMESELRVSKVEAKDAVTNLKDIKDVMRKEREQTYQELKTKLDERADQCKQIGEAYQKLQSDTEKTIASLRMDNKLLQVDLETAKRQHDTLLAEYQESLRRNEELEQSLTKLEARERRKSTQYAQLLERFEEFTNVTGKIHDLMNDMTNTK